MARQRLTALAVLGGLLAAAASIGAVAGLAASHIACSGSDPLTVFPLARQVALDPPRPLPWDATFGYPGEGPERPGPYARGGALDDVPIQVRNTFIHLVDPASQQGRSLRRVQTDGADPAADPGLSGAGSVTVMAVAPGAQRQAFDPGHNADMDTRSAGQADRVAAGQQDASPIQPSYAAASDTTQPPVPPPPPAAAAARRPRVFCPVPGCPEGVVGTASGWKDASLMRAHLNDHCGGSLVGQVPHTFLQEQGLVQCQVCSRLLAARYSPACPRCRPAMAAAAGGRASRASNLASAREAPPLW